MFAGPNVALVPAVASFIAITGDSYLIAVAGILTAVITGAFAFAGVVYNARSQRRPPAVRIDPAELERIEAELKTERELRHAAELEAARWRSAALAAMSRDTPTDRPD